MMTMSKIEDIADEIRSTIIIILYDPKRPI